MSEIYIIFFTLQTPAFVLYDGQLQKYLELFLGIHNI